MKARERAKGARFEIWRYNLKKKRVGLDLESKKFILPCNLVVFIIGIT